METHSLTQSIPGNRNEAGVGEFSSGASVIYGLLGKCAITSIETRTVGAQAIRFYKLEVHRSALSRSSRQEPAIWVPVSDASAKGLRSPITQDQVEKVLNTLSSREYYFDLNESWSSVLPKLETSIRTEGAIGLAKAASYLFVLKKRQIVPSSEITKFSENVNKLLYREIAEANGSNAKTVEEQALRLMRHKLLSDH